LACCVSPTCGTFFHFFSIFSLTNRQIWDIYTLGTLQRTAATSWVRLLRPRTHPKGMQLPPTLLHPFLGLIHPAITLTVGQFTDSLTEWTEWKLCNSTLLQANRGGWWNVSNTNERRTHERRTTGEGGENPEQRYPQAPAVEAACGS
jgi:hypothetical protein